MDNNNSTVTEIKKYGKCKKCHTYPCLLERMGGSGHIFCKCSSSALYSYAKGYSFGWKGEGKEQAIENWCKDHIEQYK